jgi:hypothetical protein
MSYVPDVFDREHGVLVWGGTLPGGETWSNSLRFAETQEVTPPANDAAGWDVQEFLDHFTDVIKAHHANGGAMISNRCMLNFVKFNRVDIHGKYIDPTTFVNVFANIAGGVSGNVHPNQVTIAVTLTTDVTRGPANRGRIYAPMPACAVADTGLISVGDAQNIRDRYAQFITDLNDTPGLDLTDPNAVVMSRKSGAPATRLITGVAVGRALDTQRRRRRNLVENYELGDVSQ